MLMLMLTLTLTLTLATPARAALYAEYRFEETSYSGSAGEATDASGNFRHATTVGGASSSASGKTCRALSVGANTTSTSVALDTGIDVNSLGDSGSISFWYYSTSTDGSDRVLVDATTGTGSKFLIYRGDDGNTVDVDLGFVVTSASGAEHSVFRNDAMSDNAWWHITVTWRLVTGGGAARIRTYVNAALQSEATFSIASAGVHTNASTLYIGDNRGTGSTLMNSAIGRFDTVRIYNHELSAAEVSADHGAVPSCNLLHHLELTHAASSGISGIPQTFTVKACANADCSSTYTAGVTGTLAGSGTGMAVAFPAGSGFSIASGSASTTRTAVITPNGMVTMGLTGVSPAPVRSPAVYCGMGAAASSGGSCVFTTTAAPLVARYRMDESSWNGSAGELADNAGYAGGPFNAQGLGTPVPVANPGTSTGARTGNPGTCGWGNFAGPTSGGGYFSASGLPVSTATGAKTSLAFWMYWTGTDAVALGALGNYSFGLAAGAIGFHTLNNDVYGAASTGLANGWHHVVAVFSNGGVTGTKLYIDGVAQALSQRVGAPNNGNAVVGGTLRIGGYNSGAGRFIGRIDEVQVHLGELSQAQVTSLYNETHACPASLVHHLEIRHGNGSGLTCTPSTLTVAACQDAGCATPYTGGISGTLTATGGTVNWPSGAGFSIAAGSSSTTLPMHLVSAGSTVLGVSGPSPAPSSAATCNFGSPSCTFSAADAALLFDVPDGLAETPGQFSVRAVKKADSSLSCTPAFASVSRNVTFKCSYTGTAAGTLPVRIGGTALNAGNNAAAACDGGGRAVSLNFDATGTAATTAIYADAGKLTLTATYTGSGADAGLTMTGSDDFVSAPFDFAVSGVSASAVGAGSNTSVTVTARNFLGATTRNFGRENTPEGVTLGFVRAAPTGAGAVSGSFGGAVGTFTNGVASAGNVSYSEVGRIDVVATLASAGYMGSSFRPAGSSHGSWVWCADEWGSCTLPAGTLNTVYYSAYTHGTAFVRTGLSGTVSCHNDVFGDPFYGWTKGCWYVSTSGVHSGNTGALTLRPHHFDVTATAACGSFSYAGQPYTASVLARNAAGDTTLNYDGTAATSPNFARAVTLSDANGLGLGTLTGGSIAATGFTAGVGSATPSYAFSAKLTAPPALPGLVLRATDSDGVSSSGGSEAGMPLRSGRLRISNAFGKATAPLKLPLTAEYWSGSAWVLNADDACTSLPAASVALSNPRDGTGAASLASTSVGAIGALVAGRGELTLTAPTPAGNGLSLDLAINLGSSANDRSCLPAPPARPTSTGAARPWLRSRAGSCSPDWDRDPAARASFGIFAPETRRLVHIRDLP